MVRTLLHLLQNPPVTNDMLEVSDDSDGDQALIAAPQAAPNREGSSTITGKSLKKGVGF